MTTYETIRVLIIDNNEISRIGMQGTLSGYTNIQVTDAIKNDSVAVQHALALKPDIILMHLTTSDHDEFQTAIELTEQHVTNKIILLTDVAKGKATSHAIKAGIRGYILANTPLEELVHAIKIIHRGGQYFSPAVASNALVELIASQRPASETSHPLTPREVEILQLVADGACNKDIAKTLHVTEATICTHMNNILSKLKLSNRVQATRYAFKHGLAPLP